MIAINTFEGGLNTDSALNQIKPNQYVHGQDLEFISSDGQVVNIPEAKLGTELKFTVPDIDAQTQKWRIRYPGNYDTSFVVNESVTVNVAGQATIAFYITAVAAAFSALSITVDVSYTDPSDTVVMLEVQGGFYFTTLTQEIDWGSESSSFVTTLLADYIPDSETLQVLSTASYGEYLFTVSVSNNFSEIGVVDGDDSYTRLLRTNRFVFSSDNPVKVEHELQNDGTHSLYINDQVLKPKTVYIPPSLTEDCCLTYTPASYLVAGAGSYGLSNTGEQTNLQLVNNMLYVTYSNQLQGGGSLTAGGKRYAARCGLHNTSATTDWCVLSNLIPVIEATIDSNYSWINIEGTPSTEGTGKINVLQINNAKSDVFSFIELAVVEYGANDSSAAYIVGKFAITGDTFTVNHTGYEQLVSLDTAELVISDPVILDAKAQEIKKNRINLASVTVATENDEYMTIAENITVSHEKFELASTGNFDVTNSGNQVLEGNDTGDVADNKLGTSRTSSDPQNFEFTTTNPNYNIATNEYTVQAADTPTLLIALRGNLTIERNTSSTTQVYVAIKILVDGVTVYDETFIQGTDVVRITKQIQRDVLVSVIAGQKVRVCWAYYQGTDVGDLFTDSYGFGVYFFQQSNSVAAQFTNKKTAEYQVPLNVSTYAGWMLNEYYPLFIHFHLNNGYITAGYPIGKYGLGTFSDPQKYINGLYRLEWDTNDLLVYGDADTTSDRTIYNYKLVLSNINLTNNPEVAMISISRGKPLGRVLGSGLLLQARDFQSGSTTEGNYFTAGVSYNMPTLSGSDDRRYFGSFISTDFLYNTPTFTTNDFLKTFGVPTTVNYTTAYRGGNSTTGTLVELLGVMSTWAAYDSGGPQKLYATGVEDAAPAAFGEASRDIYNPTYGASLKLTNEVKRNAISNASSIALTTQDKIFPYVAPATDLGFILAQYCRDIDVSNYDYKSETLTPTGTFMEVDSASVYTLDVYGGDAYTQQNIRKIANWYIDETDSFINSSFVTYYCQNRVNAQLQWNNDTENEDTYNLQGHKSIPKYLFPFGNNTEVVDEQHNFDTSYIAENIINRSEVYNPDTPYVSEQKANIYFSEKKLDNALFDAYRKIKADSYAQLDLKNGAISNLFDIRDVMVAVQPRQVTALPYETNTLLKTDDTATIVVGNNTVYTNKVIPLCSFGTDITSSSIKGFNTNGNPQVYWFSEVNRKVYRYDYSGVKCLSDDNNMYSEFNTQTELVTSEFDVAMYFDPIRQDLCITFRAQYPFNLWDASASYVGSRPFVRYVAPGKSQNFEGMYDIYHKISSVANTTGHNPFDYPSEWEYVTRPNPIYYNEWSVLFNEKKDMFTTYITPLQERYFLHNSLIYSPRQFAGFGVYELNAPDSTYLQYFAYDGDYKQGAFEIEPVINLYPQITKNFKSVGLDNGDGELIEATVTGETMNFTTTMSDYALMRGQTWYPVQPDGNNPIQGQWFKVLISKESYIKLSNILTNVMLINPSVVKRR